MVREVDGVAVYYEQRGQGRDVLLLHGWGCSTELWQPVIEALSPHVRVTALDFPGHGRSGRPPEPWGVPEFTRCLAHLMDALHIERADVIAHSFGGRVALLLAGDSPRRVGKLVITGGAGLKKPQTLKAALRGRCYKLLRGGYGLLARIPGLGAWAERGKEGLRRRFGSADYNALDEEMRKTFVKVISLDLRDTLPRIEAPTLLFWGKDDLETPLWMGREMKEKIRDAGLIEVDGGHYAYLEQGALFSRVLKSFLLGDDT